MRAFSECLRIECAPFGIGVTLLYPGPQATNIVVDGSADSEEKRALEDAFLKARGIPLERAARRSLDALRKNPFRKVIGTDYHILDALAGISPSLTNWAVRAVAARAGF